MIFKLTTLQLKTALTLDTLSFGTLILYDVTIIICFAKEVLVIDYWNLTICDIPAF